MIITQAPVRISFLGGGSDFPGHFEKNGGAVLATAIHRFAYVTVQHFSQQFFDHKMRIAWRKTEAAQSPEQIENPPIRACLQKLGISEGIELHHMADLPARTGLGSSSSFVVALLQALHAYQGRFRSAEALAREAIEVERKILNESGGWQDQIVAAYGGTSLVRFDQAHGFTVIQLPISAARLDEVQAHMLLMYTGIQRDSFTIQKRQMTQLVSNRDSLSQLGSLAEDGAELLVNSGSMERFGKLLHRGWELKKSTSEVTLPAIDDAYETGLNAGAFGGKLLGAGQGGFLLFFAPPEKHAAIKAALPGMTPMRVRIHAPGARVIFSHLEESFEA